MAYRKSLDFLPSIFQTKTNEKILRSTVDQLISEPEIKQLSGYVGRKFNPAKTKADNYISEDFADRQNYQLEPSTIYTDEEGNIKFVSGYVDLINRIGNLGGITNDPSRLFSADQYSYSGFFDFDKFTNYSNYYWLPNGPDEVSVFASTVSTNQDIEVIAPLRYSTVDDSLDNQGFGSSAFDVADNTVKSLRSTGYQFDIEGESLNPVLRLARGGTYRFNVDQPGHSFFIQTNQLQQDDVTWQKTISSREVMGVENNGEDIGTVTFNVPTRDAQDFFVNMTKVEDNVNLVAHSFKKRRLLTYNEVQNANAKIFIKEHSGIDGQQNIDGKKILFLPSKTVGQTPQPWQSNTSYREGNLVVYSNAVYKVMTDFTSGKLFSESNLSLYDNEDHWYNSAPFDDNDVGFGEANFDRGSDVNYEKRFGWFRVSIDDQGFIKLSAIGTIELNTKAPIAEGIEYGNREIYRSSKKLLETVPPITANLDYLYYVDSIDENLTGLIELVDQDNELFVNVENIISRKNYTSPNGVSLENGLKIKFVGETKPVEYRDNTYYVEGVGSSIQLVPVNELQTPESWLDTVSIEFDDTPYDSTGFDQSQPAPADKQYIAIKRNSKERSAWARQNRWFHESVIKNTNTYNNFTVQLDQNSRAKRPIIEFDPNIQMFNYGKQFKKIVTVVDVNETDALSNVEGMSVDGNVRYYSDGVPLVNGNFVLFANDNNETVRKTIYKVRWIIPESDISNRTTSFQGNGSATEFLLDFSPTNQLGLSVLIDGVDTVDSGTEWNLVGQNINFLVPPVDNSNITVYYTFTQQIHLEADSIVEEGDIVLSSLGETNQGTDWYYTNGSWVASQVKLSNNQLPLFDLYDNDRNSLSSYTDSTFAGSELFSYKLGSGILDTELGIRLSYRNIGNVGDILFSDQISSDTFSYTNSNGDTVTAGTLGHEIAKNDDVTYYENQWVKLTNKSKQYQTETFFATQTQTNRFKLNVLPSMLGPQSIVVYKNNIALTSSDFDIETNGSIGLLVLDHNLVAGDKIDVKIYSTSYNNKSVWEIPSNLENNAGNEDVTDITLGQLRAHIQEAMIHTDEFAGNYQGSNNTKDLGNIKTNSGKILQNAGAPHLANLFLNDTKANFFESLMYSQREYSSFKNKFQRLSGEIELTDLGNIPLCVDEILSELFSNKSKDFPFYHSDMVPAGDNKTVLEYTITNPDIVTYYLSNTFNIASPSNKSVLVYLNNQQLVYGKDYIFSETQPIVELLITPSQPERNRDYLDVNIGDVIKVVEYNSTDGVHVPPTPSKLGLYPAYEPEMINDGYTDSPDTMIRCHDGSLVVAFNDLRDDIILELEKRIYNNIKTRYNRELFDIFEILPGAFRTTDYNKNEFDQILSSNFSNWLGSTNLQVNDSIEYVFEDPFSWNYSIHGKKIDGDIDIPGYWRGVCRYYYDTEQPHLRPWEMLGFSKKPSWWNTVYGPAPYTRENTVLWNDLETGTIQQGTRAGIDIRFARPGLSNVIPVDDEGSLLPPIYTVSNGNYSNNVVSFKFGDGAPVESLWRNSSEYPYAIQLALALSKPAEYFGLLRNTDRQIKKVYNTDNVQWEFSGTGIRSKTEYIHGEVVNNEVVKSSGYLNWIGEYLTGLSLDITEEAGRKLRDNDLRLAYKVSGYTDKKYIKLFADQSSPDSVNSSVMIPDEDFQIKLVKSSPRVSVTYSGVIVSKSRLGYTVRGYDQTRPYFTIESGKASSETITIKQGPDGVDVSKYGSGEFFNVPYGTEFRSKAEVVEFLVGLERYQVRQGFRFNKKADGLTEYQTWRLSAKEFLFWTQQGWEDDISITLSPIGNEIEFRSSRGSVDAISNRPYGSRVLDSNAQIIDSNNYTVNRDGRQFTLTVGNNKAIYLVDIDVVDYEHVIVLNNVTKFNDIIYQPSLGNRQYRIKVNGFKSAGWDGSFGAPGFIINDNTIQTWQQGKNYYKGEIIVYKGRYYVAKKNIAGSSNFDTVNFTETTYNKIDSTLLPNLANKAAQPKSFYDFNQSNLELDADSLGKGAIGFSKRDYLENLGISDTSQVKFYQGLIRQKGSNNSLDKMLRAKLDNFDGSAEFFEQWAIRDGSYGATGNTNELRFPIAKSDKTKKSPLVVEFLDDGANKSKDYIELNSSDLLTYPKPYDKNFFGYRDKKNKVKDLTTAGFLKISDVDYVSPSLAAAGANLDDNVIDGSRIWIGQDIDQAWNAYRFCDINVPLVRYSVNSASELFIQTSVSHGLAADQYVYLKFFDRDSFLCNYYRVSTIIDDNTFSIANVKLNLTMPTDVKGQILTLLEIKKENIGQLSEHPLNGWKQGDQFYLTEASESGWGIYERLQAYTDYSSYSDSEASTDDNLGVSVAAANNNQYLLAGSSNTKTVKIYSGTPLTESQQIVNPSTGLDDFAKVMAASNSDYVAVGSPTSGSNTGYVHLLKNDSSNNWTVSQALAPSSGTGNFGSSIAISDDAQWLYIGQPNTGNGNVQAYQLIQIENPNNISQLMLADGSSSFTITGGAVALATSIYSLRIEYAGNILIPFRDYTYNTSSNVISFTFTPTSDVSITFNDYYKYVDTISFASFAGDLFGYAISTTTTGNQLIVGAPTVDNGSVSDSGTVFVVDRTIESFYVNDNTLFQTVSAVNGTPVVSVNSIVKTAGVDYNFNGVDTFNFITSLSNGSIVTIHSNDFVLTQTVVDNEGTQENAQFGYSLDICPYNCSLYVGAPFEDDTVIDGGKVHRFINQGRFFGTVSGDIENPTISGNTSVLINNFNVSLTIGNNLENIIDAINDANIPGVTASNNENTLRIVTDSRVIGDKLNIAQLSGDFLGDTGIDVYAVQQVIESPVDKNYNNFGKVVKIAPDAVTLVVATDNGDTLLNTTFDTDTTVLDNRNTEFFSYKKQSGAAFVYQYINNYSDSVDTPGKFIFAEQLENFNIGELDQFGESVAVTNNSIFVGSPGWDLDNEANDNQGLVYEFARENNNKTWNLTRSETDKVNLDLINNVYLYNTETGEKIVDMDIIDPAKGRVSGLALQEIDYITTNNPASYAEEAGISWGENYVGKLWWNTSRVQWVEYEQDNLEYRAANWGFSFPGSSVVCAEWTASDTTPANYVDPMNPSAFVLDTTKYNTETVYNETTGTFSNVYYFWVAGKTRAPRNTANRSLSAVQVEQLISDPKLNNLPYVAFLDQNSVGLYNVTDLLENNTALVINYDKKINESVIHSEYKLIGEGDQTSVPTSKILNKLIDSLAGQDKDNRAVPDTALNDYLRYGVQYRPRQTMFRDRKKALKEAVAYVNYILKDIPVVYSKNINAVVASELYPGSQDYDESVENHVELTYLDAEILNIGYNVLVKSDENTKGRWVVYTLQSDRTWNKTRIQAWDNNRYIDKITWTDPDTSVPDVVDTVVQYEYNLQTLIAAEGDIVKILDNGAGLFKVVKRENNTWVTVQEEQGTLEVKKTIWDNDGILKIVEPSVFYEDWPGLEIQKIFHAIYNDIFADEHSIEKNKWFLHMIKYVISESEYNDWVFKTSLIKVNQTQRALQQIPVYQKDNQDLIRSYIDEVKPYHTKISEYVLQYKGNDLADLKTTDFDLPAYYSFTTNSYRSPTGATVEDSQVLQLDPYVDWTENYKLELDDIIINDPGNGYFVPPEIVISGGGGSGATARAVVNAGKIIDVIVEKRGNGYITTPTVSVVQEIGSNAKLSAKMINKKVRSFDTTIKFDRVATTAGWLVHFKNAADENVDVRNEKINKVQDWDVLTSYSAGDVVKHYIWIHNEDEDTYTKEYFNFIANSNVTGEEPDEFDETYWTRYDLNIVAGRVPQSAGVLDYVLDILSNGKWFTSPDKFPVEGVPNFRPFDDTSGRVQFFDRRDSRGWTPKRLQTAIRELGTSAGVNGIDISGTTVIEDGSLASFMPSILSWEANTNFYQDDIVLFNNKVYKAKADFTSGTAFTSTNFDELAPVDLKSHLDRTWALYQPTTGMLGKDLGQLFSGTVFPGVNVIGASFATSSGFDGGLFDTNSFDGTVLGPEGVPVIDPGILDQTIRSEYLDTTLGTKPEDVITQGGQYVDVYHSHAPEEHVPGRVYDTLEMRVHTTNSSATMMDYGLDWTIMNHKTDGSTTRFSFIPEGIDTKCAGHVGDHFIVHLRDAGPRYRDIEDSGQAVEPIVPVGSYYHTNQMQGYTVDWENHEIVFETAPTGDDLISIYNVRLQGESILYNDVVEGNGSAQNFTVVAPYESVEHSLIMVNGVESNNAMIQNNPDDPGRTIIAFNTPPADGDHIHIILSSNQDQNTISRAYTQLEMLSNTNRTVVLDQDLRFDRSKDTVVIAELNGQRLKPGNTSYYTGDGSTLTFDLPNSAKEAEMANLTNAEVQVWIDSVRQEITSYSLSAADGVTLPDVTFLTAPDSGSDISITYTGEADYSYDVTNNSIAVSPAVTVNDGDLLAITSFSAHDLYKIKTKVFIGTDSLVSTIVYDSEFDSDSVAFDAAGFEADTMITRVTPEYSIDNDQNNASKIFVSLNGKTLLPNHDFTLGNGIVRFSKEAQVTDTTEVIITWSNATEYTDSTTFQIFQNLNGEISYSRLADCETTELALDLAITDTTIEVLDASVLEVPNKELGKPGVIFVNSERITYYTITGNTLGQIRRGTEGTGAKDLHAVHSIVVNAGESTKVPNPHSETWYNLGGSTPSDGSGLQNSTTPQANFLKKKKGLLLTEALPSVLLNKFIDDGYVDDDYVNDAPSIDSGQFIVDGYVDGDYVEINPFT